MRRIMRVVRGPALLAGLLLVGIGAVGSGSSAAPGTPESREACTPDAMRLCSDFIPDVDKITKCMIHKHAQLSAPCRLAMANGHKGGEYHRHRWHGHRHCGRGRHCA